jgi:hypothetical protein
MPPSGFGPDAKKLHLYWINLPSECFIRDPGTHVLMTRVEPRGAHTLRILNGQTPEGSCGCSREDIIAALNRLPLPRRTASARWLTPGKKSAPGETSTTVSGRTAVWATERQTSLRDTENPNYDWLRKSRQCRWLRNFRDVRGWSSLRRR